MLQTLIQCNDSISSASTYVFWIFFLPYKYILIKTPYTVYIKLTMNVINVNYPLTSSPKLFLINNVHVVENATNPERANEYKKFVSCTAKRKFVGWIVI